MGQPASFSLEGRGSATRNQRGSQHQQRTAETTGWDEAERELLQAQIAARQPFLDFAFSRVNADGSTQRFRVSGEPMFDPAGHCVGYRGIGAEVSTRHSNARA